MRFVLLLCFLVYLFPHFSSYIIVITNSFGICSLSLSLSTFSRYFLPLSLSNKQNMDHHSLTHSRSLSLSFTLITLFIDAWLCGIKTKTMRRKNTFSSVPFLFSPRPFVFLFFLFIFSYFLVTIVGFAAPAIPIWRYLFQLFIYLVFATSTRRLRFEGSVMLSQQYRLPMADNSMINYRSIPIPILIVTYVKSTKAFGGRAQWLEYVWFFTRFYII